MKLKKHLTIYILFVAIVALAATTPSFADTSSEKAQQLRDSIKSSYGIIVYDYADNNGYINASMWSISYLQAMLDVFRDMPEEFTSCTKMIYMDQDLQGYEIKYNGYNEEYGVIQFGQGAFTPSAIYYKKYQEIYRTTPSQADLINRFKTMLIRGMAYAFMQSNTDDYGRSELMQKYQAIYASNPSFPTRLYSPGDESFMIVAPGKNHLWTDLAFAVAKYCTDAAGLQSKYPRRYEFVKDYVFGGCGVDGWQDKWLDGSGSTNGGNGHTGSYNEPVVDTDTSTGTGTGTGTGTNTNTSTGTDTNTNTGTDTNTDTSTGTDTDTGIISIEDRSDIPAIPDDKYYPVVSQLDASGSGISKTEWKTMPKAMKIAIKELFDELPKYFTTCTRGINYTPTSDTADAFSSESYIFVTNNSWFAPSFTAMDDTLRAKRFKQILVREMTKCFLYYHGSKITRWRAVFGTGISDAEAKNDIIEASVLYYTDQQYMDDLQSLRRSFIKTNIYSNN